jgi:hypothetical protein
VKKWKTNIRTKTHTRNRKNKKAMQRNIIKEESFPSKVEKEDG